MSGKPAKKKPVVNCQWFALCKRPATTTQHHPILGDVPVCQKCKDWYNKK